MKMTAPARLIVVLGPTASGKSALAIELAKRLNGEILVCDSTQVYRHFDIGTAKSRSPNKKHPASPRRPRRARRNLHRRRLPPPRPSLARRSPPPLETPIIAAGTGLYLRALLEGLADAPSAPKNSATASAAAPSTAAPCISTKSSLASTPPRPPASPRATRRK